jgi:hypothetical protein
MTAVAAAFGADQIGNTTEMTRGFSAGLLGAAAVAAVGAALAAILLSKPATAAHDSSDSELIAA